MAKTVRIEEIWGCEGNCITINDTRIAGPKPWGGGHVIKKWDARVDHILKALGVDVTEVVRCKDCVSYEEQCPNFGYCYHWDYEQGMSPNQVDADDFCSYGERRTDEQG